MNAIGVARQLARRLEASDGDWVRLVKNIESLAASAASSRYLDFIDRLSQRSETFNRQDDKCCN